MLWLKKVLIFKKKNNKLFIIIILIAVFFIFELIYLAFYIYRQKISIAPLSSPVAISAQETQKAIDKFENFKKEIEALQVKTATESDIPKISEAINNGCWQIKTDPLNGAVTRGKVNEEGLFQYVYLGVIKSVKEIKETNCSFWQVEFIPERKTSSLVLILPATLLLQDDSLGKVSVEVLKNHVDEQMEIKLNVQNLDTGKWEVKEWLELRFFL